MTKWCVFSSSTDIRHNLYKLFKQIKLYMHNYPIIINYSFSVAHLSIPFKVLFTEICIRRTVKKKLFHLPYSKSTWDRFIYVDLNHTVKHSTGSYASTPSYPQPSSGRRFNIDVIAHRTNLRFIYNLLQHVSGPVLSLSPCRTFLEELPEWELSGAWSMQNRGEDRPLIGGLEPTSPPLNFGHGPPRRSPGPHGSRGPRATHGRSFPRVIHHSDMASCW